VVNRFDVHLVQQEPTRGSEIRKTRPCVVISPDEMHSLRTVIIAPMTTKGRACPSRVPVEFQGKHGFIVLDQVRTIDRERLVKKLGRIDEAAAQVVLTILQEMFAP